MRTFIFFIIALFLLSCVSCKKEVTNEFKDINDTICNYNLYYYPYDTSLYISFNLDNKEICYYQKSPFNLSGWSLGTAINDSIFIGNCKRCISFDSLNKSYQSDVDGLLYFRFSKKLRNNRKNYKYYDTLNILSIIKDSMVFEQTIYSKYLSDTIFLDGIDLTYYYDSSKYKSFNYSDNIKNKLSDSNIFHLTKVQSVCNDFVLFEGIFSTKIKSDSEILTITNGKFRFINKKNVP